ncbi:MAG: hypothetical protein RQM92_11820 [Candidatus Syntrophopropionicum ammoniitolerans]
MLNKWRIPLKFAGLAFIAAAFAGFPSPWPWVLGILGLVLFLATGVLVKRLLGVGQPQLKIKHYFSSVEGTSHDLRTYQRRHFPGPPQPLYRPR